MGGQTNDQEERVPFWGSQTNDQAEGSTLLETQTGEGIAERKHISSKEQNTYSSSKDHNTKSSSKEHNTDPSSKEHEDSSTGLFSDRSKAIIFVNLSALFATFVNATHQKEDNKEGVNSLDFLFFCMLGLFLGSFLAAQFTCVPLYPEPKDRFQVMLRSTIGAIGFICGAYGLPMVQPMIENSIYSAGPFFAAALGCMVLSERLTVVEITSLFVGAAAVVCIAYGSEEQNNADAKKDDKAPQVDERADFWRIIGIVLMLANAFMYACVTVLARQLQSVSFLVLLFWQGLLAAPATMIFTLVESHLREQEIKILSYTAQQYLWELLPVALNFFAVSTFTIASQNERSGFVTLIGYISLVYSFLGDLIVSQQSPAMLELIGVVVLLLMTICIVCQKWSPEPAPKERPT